MEAFKSIYSISVLFFYHKLTSFHRPFFLNRIALSLTQSLNIFFFFPFFKPMIGKLFLVRFRYQIHLACRAYGLLALQPESIHKQYANEWPGCVTIKLYSKRPAAGQAWLLHNSSSLPWFWWLRQNIQYILNI